ncbi:RBBP9/YdeN family alpha/beta hydrolase [Flavitalea antarctica]
MKYLIIPGLHGSGADHWQTKWEESDPTSFMRVEQNSWESPDKLTWTNTINQYIQVINEPVILIAHSLGCIAVAHWAQAFHSEKIAGALLVAPADVERSSREAFKTFAPVPEQPLPFRTIVVASENDQYAEAEKLNMWATRWQATFINVGRKGHINSASGIGFWHEGHQLLYQLATAAPEVYA